MIAGPGGWCLTPEGAAVLEAERTAVVADVHLGYEWSRAAGGDVVPEHSLRETIAKLGRLFDRCDVARLIVAGDLTESASPCPRTARDVERLRHWLSERGVSLVALAGNHDPPRRPPWPSTIEVGGWTIGHGHRPIAGKRIMFGHHHPAIRAGGLVAPCFLVDERTIALPAFSMNAAGLDVLTAGLPEALRGRSMRCVAGAGAELLDFGPLERLRAKSGAV